MNLRDVIASQYLATLEMLRRPSSPIPLTEHEEMTEQSKRQHTYSVPLLCIILDQNRSLPATAD